MPERLLILNPGSTSTKAAVYDGTRPLFSRSIPHSNQDLAPFPTLNDQLDYRVALVRGLLAQERVDLSTLTAWSGACWPRSGWTCPPSPPWWAEAASCPTSWPGATR